MPSRTNNFKKQNSITLESRRFHAADMYRRGFSREAVVASLRKQYGVGLGRKYLDLLERTETPKQQLVLGLAQVTDPVKTLEKVPQNDAVLIIKHMIQKGFHCFILPDGQLELRWS
jgi:hypothetical protein